MASFLVSLWESIFTPGPTPPLLLATNATFGALQILLLALFAATYSFHFIALSFICGGLWWAINWFATEVARARATEAEADRIRRHSSSLNSSGAGGGGPGTPAGTVPRLSEELEAAEEEDLEDTDTETEVDARKRATHRLRPKRGSANLKVDLAASHSSLGSAVDDEDEGRASGVAGSQARLGPQDAGPVRRKGSALEMSGTDSEWEKVDGDRI